MRTSASASRLAADGGGRMQHPGERHRTDRLRQLGADRRPEVLDVRDLHERRLRGGGHPHGVRGEHPRDPAGDDRVLLTVLLASEQLLAEVVIDRRIGAAPGRAGERDRARALPVSADEELRTGGEEHRVATSHGEHEARRELLAQ